MCVFDTFPWILSSLLRLSQKIQRVQLGPPPSCVSFISLARFFSAPIFKDCQTIFFLQCMTACFTPTSLHNSSSKITVLYILIFMFSDSIRKTNVPEINGSKNSPNFDALSQTKIHSVMCKYVSRMNWTLQITNFRHQQMSWASVSKQSDKFFEVVWLSDFAV